MRMNVLAGTTLLTFATAASAATVPFTENFDTGPANWRESTGGANLDWNATGGPDGDAYASTPFSFGSLADGDTPALFRGHDTFDSSGDAFVGNWIGEGIDTFSVAVRHNAPLPLTLFTRFSGPANFPGAIAVNFIPVLPNTWTTVTIPINPGNPQFVTFEGGDFSTFNSIANVQVGYEVPAGFGGNPASFTFDIDRPTIVPEPTTAAALLACLGLVRRRR